MPIGMQQLHLHNTKSRNIFPYSMENVSVCLPLWQEDMKGTTIIGYCPKRASCAVTGGVWGSTGITMDGDDWINLVNFTATFNVNTFTIIIWAYMANWADGSSRELFDFGDAGGNNRVLIRKQAADTLLWYMTSGGNSQIATIGATATPAAGWHHFALSFTTNSAIARLDLTTVGTDPDCIPMAAQPTLGALGSYRDGGAGSYFAGIMGECWVFNKVLSLWEITMHHTVTKWRYM